nr:DUF4034 domain-containing protein [Candidatus Acidoferrales bacterium]
MRKCSLVLILPFCALLPVSVKAQSADAKLPNTEIIQRQSEIEASFGSIEDSTAIREYRSQMRELLTQENFVALDSEAVNVRASKARFTGGAWKLHVFYNSVDYPAAPVPTDADFEKHISLLKRWVAASPESITARVALAHVYLSYAFAARGNGQSNTVTANGWKLFKARTAQAKAVLDGAHSLNEKCPEWYLAMLGVGLQQDWNNAQQAEIYRQASEFEPEYYQFYVSYANYLQPKWDGAPGDAAEMAAEVADRVGGERGDFLYFEIAQYVAGRGNKPEIKQFSWERIQSGHAALEHLYGSTYTDLNQYALLAYRFKDVPMAQKLFTRIGNHWNSGVWRTHQNYQTARAQMMTAG